MNAYYKMHLLYHVRVSMKITLSLLGRFKGFCDVFYPQEMKLCYLNTQRTEK